MPRLTKKQFEDMFRAEVLPHVIERYEQRGFPDKPARREAWNNTVDAYIRDGTLPEAAGNWGHPRWLETWSPKRRANEHDYSTKRRAHATKKSPAQLDHEIAKALGRKDKSTACCAAHSTVKMFDAPKPSLTVRQINAIVRAADGRNIYLIRTRLGDETIQRITSARTKGRETEVRSLATGNWIPVLPERGDKLEVR